MGTFIVEELYYPIGKIKMVGREGVGARLIKGCVIPAKVVVIFLNRK